jgi:farnesyl-diphosphate farnesyltransferase
MSAASSAESQFLLTDLLRDVSRSFYITLRLLPGPIRSQIGLAYLLARATDTIADTGAISVEQRLETLQQLRARILGQSSAPLLLPDLRAQQSSEAERLLLERIEDALAVLRGLEHADRQSIQRVLETITSGQELDLRRFGHASEKNIVTLRSAAELEDYTYRVAGCVGEFWTEICFRHLKAPATLSQQDLVAKGIRFGQGLQLVNILRDLPADLRAGRCYLPEQELASVGLAPAGLLDPASEQRLRPVYQGWLARAEEHLSTAWSYVLDLPRSWVRVRVACALPVLIGVKTLNKLRAANVLNPDTRIKVSRQDVKQIMRASILFYPVNSVWKNLPARVIRT